MTRPSPNEPLSAPLRPGQTPVIGYETPAHLRADESAWRQGTLVVMIRGNAVLPKFCFKCGTPTSVFVRGGVVYARSFLSPQLRANVSVPLCEAHRKRLKSRRLDAWILAVLGTCLLFVGMRIESAWMLIASVPILFLSPVSAFLGNLPVKAKHIDAQFVTLKGAGEEFLEKLPEI